jgi:hypothetical protein
LDLNRLGGANQSRLGRKEPISDILTIDCDYHPGVQQIAFMYTEMGEFGERRLEHGEREAEKFYRDLQQTEVSVRVGGGNGACS